MLRPEPELPAVARVVIVGAEMREWQGRVTRVRMGLARYTRFAWTGVVGVCDSSSGAHQRGGRGLRLRLRVVLDREIVVLRVEPSQPHVEDLRQPEPPRSRERDNDVLFDLPARGVIRAES